MKRTFAEIEKIEKDAEYEQDIGFAQYQDRK
jgi:hypothetical protein